MLFILLRHVVFIRVINTKNSKNIIRHVLPVMICEYSLIYRKFGFGIYGLSTGTITLIWFPLLMFVFVTTLVLDCTFAVRRLLLLLLLLLKLKQDEFIF